MDYLSSKEEQRVPKCKMKRTDNPDCAYYKNTIPYESAFKRNQLLPSPIVSWADCYQTIPEAAREIKRDFIWMKKLKEKSDLIKKRREYENGKEQ